MERERGEGEQGGRVVVERCYAWYNLDVDGQRPTVTIHLERRWVPWVLGVLLVLQVVVPSRAWIALFTAVGGMLALGYAWTRAMANGLSLSREQLYGWAHVGDLLEERFELRNRGLLSALWVEIDDQSDLPGYSARTVRSADAHQSVQWRTEGICRQRGLFTLGPCQVQCSDPFGFFRLTLDYRQTQSILVYPPVVHLPALQLPRGAAQGSGRTNRAVPEVTANAASVREYAPGDGLNRVHWRSTARLQSLMVKTFDLEPSGNLWILLDLDAAVQCGEGEDSTEEYGVILASSLADRFLRENRAVGLAAYGTYGTRRTAAVDTSEPLPVIVMPDRGQAHRWRILHALATVRAGGHWPLRRVLAEMDSNLGRGTTLAVITPSCDPDWPAGLLSPMRRGVAPAAILLDPGSFGGEGRVEPMAGLLADLGVAWHIVEKGMPFKPVVEHERLGRPEYKVLRGTGRVVAVVR